jgi:sulfate transport system ATP-binding protein
VDIRILGISKEFGSTGALRNVSIDIGDGELVALLGPSGSGKTTLLRVIAGLETPSVGRVLFANEDATRLSVQGRRIGFVFQHYALFKHLSVFENIAYGLRVRSHAERPPNDEIAKRVYELLELVQLPGIEKRYPAQLSGGQRQRVALARALAIEPRLLLLDEPFGALDAQVRVNLRRWLREFHRSLGVTTLFVTHDQDEAMEMADRVVVMNRGRIEQIGTPEQIYRQPATPFASRFIARGQALPGEVRGQHLHLFGHAWRLENFAADDAHEIAVHVRPEDIALAPVSAEGLKAQLLSLRHVAGTVRASLRVENREDPLEAEWNERDWARHGGGEVGDVVDVHLQALTVFAMDREGRVQARSTVHPPHASFPVAVGPWRRVEA